MSYITHCLSDDISQRQSLSRISVQLTTIQIRVIAWRRRSLHWNAWKLYRYTSLDHTKDSSQLPLIVRSLGTTANGTLSNSAWNHSVRLMPSWMSAHNTGRRLAEKELSALTRTREPGSPLLVSRSERHMQEEEEECRVNGLAVSCSRSRQYDRVTATRARSCSSAAFTTTTMPCLIADFPSFQQTTVYDHFYD